MSLDQRIPIPAVSAEHSEAMGLGLKPKSSYAVTNNGMLIVRPAVVVARVRGRTAMWVLVANNIPAPLGVGFRAGHDSGLPRPAHCVQRLARAPPGHWERIQVRSKDREEASQIAARLAGCRVTGLALRGGVVGGVGVG